MFDVSLYDEPADVEDLHTGPGHRLKDTDWRCMACAGHSGICPKCQGSGSGCMLCLGSGIEFYYEEVRDKARRLVGILMGASA